MMLIAIVLQDSNLQPSWLKHLGKGVIQAIYHIFFFIIFPIAIVRASKSFCHKNLKEPK